MKNLHYFFILLISLNFTSCYKKTPKDILVGSWKFETISFSDTTENFLEFENSDSFNLKTNGLFNYSIRNLSLVKNGKWNTKKDSLFLHYQKPDTTRIFVIQILSSNSLLLKEGNNFFKFKR
jgi:hypothetical protein